MGSDRTCGVYVRRMRLWEAALRVNSRAVSLYPASESFADGPKRGMYQVGNGFPRRAERMQATVQRIASIGECMVELYDAGGGTTIRGFGGDTLNTAVYLARATAGRAFAVDYVTALGDDPFSDEMLAAWAKEGLGTTLVARLPGRLPGLYMIRTGAGGERSFYYWRSAAAARDLFRAPEIDAIARRLARYALIYVSGISVSILDEPSRERLFGILDHARRAGAKVAADTNYRPRNWSGPDEARTWTEELFRRADYGLPSAEDQAALFGDETPEAAADRLHGLGVVEVVVKGGGNPALLSWPGRRSSVPPEPVGDPIDTTAAGDSFNAGYLAGRLLDLEPEAAARQGHRIAVAVVMHRGAIIPREAMPSLDVTG